MSSLVILWKKELSFDSLVLMLRGTSPMPLSVDLRVSSSEEEMISLTFFPEESIAS
jgi:hypothetical protein